MGKKTVSPASRRELRKIISLLSGALLVSNSLLAGDVVGKLTVGYQGWFTCSGDGSPRVNKWIHWSTNTALAPSPGNSGFDLYPDVREFTSLYQTGYGNLGNGQPAKLYSSWTSSTVNKHFEWIKTYGIDTVAAQRFGASLHSDTNVLAWKNGILTKVRDASVTYGRKFYVMYDISSWTTFNYSDNKGIRYDWTNRIRGLNITNSGAYAKEDGKPVVCVWGIGEPDRPGDGTSWKSIVDFLKGQGCYVIIGVNDTWRDSTNVAHGAANMISPWTVGDYTGTSTANSYTNRMKADKSWCDSRGIAYQPVVWPGFAWYNWNGGTKNQIPRNHGDFMWTQFYNVKNCGNSTVYVAMFDEFDEATAICKAAEDSSMKPANQYFLTLDADGTSVSSDFYLRLTGDGAKMVKGQISKTSSHPTAHAATKYTSVATEDGFIIESSETSNVGGSINSTGTGTAGVRIGDTATRQQYKAIVSFDTAGLPDGATILSATLKLKRGTTSGSPTNLGAIRADVIGGNGFANNKILQTQDFQVTTDVAVNVATLNYPSANGQWAMGVLSATGLTKINKTGRTQLRIYFATDDDNDGTSDYLGFYASDNATAANRPVLEITYR